MFIYDANQHSFSQKKNKGELFTKVNSNYFQALVAT